MSITTLVDRVKIIAPSSGTGPFQLGTAVSAYRGVEALTDGATYSYAVESDAQYEIGYGVYVAAQTMLVRTPLLSSNGGAPISFPANVEISFTALAEDIVATGATLPIVQSTGQDPASIMSQKAVSDNLAGKQGSLPTGTAAQYYRGDQTLATLNKTAVGLANVDNTSDVNKPVSTATQTALGGKVGLTALQASDGAGLVGFSPTSAQTANSAGQWLNWLGALDNLYWYGFVGDGASHPLSSVLFFKDQVTIGWTLTNWKAAVPQVSSLTNEIDGIAIQAWFNDRVLGGALYLPPCVARISKAIEVGAAQSFALYGAGRELTKLQYYGTNGLVSMGYGTVAASGTFTAERMTVVPKVANAGICFDVRFAGDQRAWCHTVRDVLIYPEDGTSFFTQATRTWNIKRGLSWENFVVYGRHFFIQPTWAHTFPPNVGALCPPGQSQQIAGNSYAFRDSMVVGYYGGALFDFTGFTSSTEHCHEELYASNFQVYSSVAYISWKNTNGNYAPSDNVIIETPGWQGTGPCFDVQNVELLRVTGGGLLVDDVTTVPNHVVYGNLIDVKSALIECEIFSVLGSTGLTGFFVGGPGTQNVKFRDLDVSLANNPVFDQFLYIAPNVPAGGVDERGTVFRGSGTFTAGRVVDASNLQVSETRAKDAAAAGGGTAPMTGSSCVSILSDGTIAWEATYRMATTDAFGNVTPLYPSALFRSVIGAPLAVNANASDTPFPVVSNPGNTGGATVRFTNGSASPSNGTMVSVRIRQLGR